MNKTQARENTRAVEGEVEGFSLQTVGFMTVGEPYHSASLAQNTSKFTPPTRLARVEEQIVHMIGEDSLVYSLLQLNLKANTCRIENWDVMLICFLLIPGFFPIPSWQG